MFRSNVHFFFILFYFLGGLKAEPNLVVLQNFENLKKIQIGRSCRDNTSCNYWNELLAEENQYSRFAGIIPSSIKKCKNLEIGNHEPGLDLLNDLKKNINSPLSEENYLALKLCQPVTDKEVHRKTSQHYYFLSILEESQSQMIKEIHLIDDLLADKKTHLDVCENSAWPRVKSNCESQTPCASSNDLEDLAYQTQDALEEIANYSKEIAKTETYLKENRTRHYQTEEYKKARVKLHALEESKKLKLSLFPWIDNAIFQKKFDSTRDIKQALKDYLKDKRRTLIADSKEGNQIANCLQNIKTYKCSYKDMVSYLAQKKPAELNRKINSTNSYSSKWLKYQECLLDNQEANLQNENDYRRALTDTLLIGGTLMTGVAAPLSTVALEARQVAFLKNILSAEKYINSANLLNGVKQSIEECSRKIQTVKLSTHESSKLKCEYKDLYFSSKMTNLFDSCLSQAALSFLDATPLAVSKFQRALQTKNLTLAELKELERLESSDEYLYKLWPEEHRHHHLAVQGVSKTSAEKIAFTRSFQNYNPTSINQNKNYIQFAESAFDRIYTSNSKYKALVIENSVLKPLNTLYNDRDFVTSLTNLHKSILMKQMTPFIEKWRKKGISIASYSDFKSMKFLMRGDFPPELEKELAVIYQQTNKDYADYLIKNKIVRKEDHPEDWFRGGLGNSDEQASSQAKMARDNLENNLENFNNPSTLEKINTTVDNMNELLNHETQGIGRYFEKIGISKKDENMPGVWSFDQEAIDILRKSENTTQAQIELAHRFNSNNISIDSVERLKKYFDEVNKLPASLLISERKFASFSPTTKGGISFDMIGMGSVNLEETSLAVQKAFSKPLPTTNSEIEKANQVLYQSRQAEKKATAEFLKRQKKLTEIVTSTLGKDRVSVICSGDDCIVNLTSALSIQEKNKLTQNISNSNLGNQFRMSFASDKVADTSAMTQLTNEGESIAKAVKKIIALELEPRRIPGLTISIDMETPTLGAGPIRLIYAMNSSVILSPAEKQKIKQAYKIAVKKHNIKLQKENYPGYDAF